MHVRYSLLASQATTAIFVLLWGSAAIFTRWGLDNASPMALLVFRFLVALVALAPLAIVRRRWLPAPVTVQAAAGTSAPALAAPTQRWMWLMIATYFCAGFGFVTSATFIVAILVKLPLLAGKGSWVWVIVGLAAAPSGFVWDRVANALGRMHALMIAYGLQIISIILPVFSDSPALNVLGALLFGATFVGIVSLTLTIVGRHFPANPAKAMAKMTLSYGVAQIVAPAMAGYIATATGSYHGALIVTAVFMLAGMALLQALINEEKRAPH